MSEYKDNNELGFNSEEIVTEEAPIEVAPVMEQSAVTEVPAVEQLGDAKVPTAPAIESPKASISPVIEQPKVPTSPGLETPKVSVPTSTPPQQVYSTYKFSKEVKPAKKKVKTANGTGKKFALCVALALVFGLVSGAVFQGINIFSNYYYGTNNKVSVEEIEIPPTVVETAGLAEDNVALATPTASTGAGNVADVAANSMPSVVAISNVGVQEVQNFFGTQQYESESSGSGIIVGQNDEELLIATNNHVIAGATTITVTFIDDNSVEAQIKGTDSDNDLAVVAVNIKDIAEETLAEIKVATIGDSDKLTVGEQVVAIGNALGYGQSVTSGYVSALGREVEVDDYTANLIQTDAAINPGNSGGALLNMQGELIGINAVKFAANGIEGMGYAIPVSTAEPILGELMNRMTRFKVAEDKSAYLGVSCREVTKETAEMYNMPVGVFVAEVVEGASADRGGIKKGDIITKMDGQSIRTYKDLVEALSYYEAGESISIVVARAEGGEYNDHTLMVELDARPVDLEE